MDTSPPHADASDAEIERERLAILASLRILDTPPEREIDALVQAAQRISGCKMVAFSLVDRDRQWFKSRLGLDATETPRAWAFCAHAVAANDALIVRDATTDARFATNPLVVGAPNIRFYAGIPIRARQSGLADLQARALPMGTLCVIDDSARDINDDQMAMLAELAHVIEQLLATRALAEATARLAAKQTEALQALNRTHRQLHQAERMANMGSWRLTLADNRTEWSDQTYVIHGLPVGESPPLSAALEFFPVDTRPIVQDAVSRAIAIGEPFDLELDFLTAQGEERRVRSLGEIELIDGQPVSLIGVFQDITSRYLMEQGLRTAAHTDELTRIASRARFIDYLDQAIVRAVAHHETLALAVLDLDKFKAVNDRYGHPAGDDLLRLMASRLSASYLDGSFAARLGGDEFVVVITSPSLLADLPGLLQRMLADLRHVVGNGEDAIQVSATIGACWLSDTASDRPALLKQADAALYQAKNACRGTAKVSGTDMLIAVRDLAKPLRLVPARRANRDS